MKDLILLQAVSFQKKMQAGSKEAPKGFMYRQEITEAESWEHGGIAAYEMFSRKGKNITIT